MAALETPPVTEGWLAADFSLLGIDGKQHSIQECKGQAGLVIAFICNHCPYVKAIAKKIAREADELQKIGVGFVAINSNDYSRYPEDSYEKMITFAAENSFSFPYLIDKTQEIARAYQAVCTPDFFGFDSGLRLRYRGRLDSARKEDIPDAKRELFIAMSRVAKGEDIIDPQHPSIGCSIKWKE